MLVAFASRASAVLKNNMNCINYINTVAIITNTVYLVRSSNMSLFRKKADKNKKNTKPQRNPDYIVHANLSNMKFTIHR